MWPGGQAGWVGHHLVTTKAATASSSYWMLREIDELSMMEFT